MAKAELFTKTGTKTATKLELDKDIFDLEVKNQQLLYEAVRSYQAASRQVGAHALTRGEVRGGGKKPWRQKGTGRARVGSRRSPIWVGGGVTFGPTGKENYRVDLTKKARRLALCQALSLKANKGALKVIETFSTEGKVKPTLELMKKIEAQGRILLVVSSKDKLVERATGNLVNVAAIQAEQLNPYLVLTADTIVVSRKSLDVLKAWLGVTVEATAKPTTKTIKVATGAKS